MIGNIHKHSCLDEPTPFSTMEKIKSVTIIRGDEAKRIIRSEKFPFAEIGFDKNKCTVCSEFKAQPQDIMYRFNGEFRNIEGKYVSFDCDNDMVILDPDCS